MQPWTGGVAKWKLKQLSTILLFSYWDETQNPVWFAPWVPKVLIGKRFAMPGSDERKCLGRMDSCGNSANWRRALLHFRNPCALIWPWRVHIFLDSCFSRIFSCSWTVSLKGNAKLLWTTIVKKRHTYFLFIGDSFLLIQCSVNTLSCLCNLQCLIWLNNYLFLILCAYT